MIKIIILVQYFNIELSQYSLISVKVLIFSFRYVRDGKSMVVTIILFLVFINPGSAQYWCPGSNIPAVCCSKLLSGDIKPEYALFETDFLSPMDGYNDIEIGDEPMDLATCHEQCKVCSVIIILNYLLNLLILGKTICKVSIYISYAYRGK